MRSLPIHTPLLRNEPDWTQIAKALLAIACVVAIVVAGGVLGQVLGAPKAFFLIVTAMAMWLVTGWFLGGWRAVLGGLTALAAALCASDGTYPLAMIFSALALFSLFAQFFPREISRPSKSVN
jgi:hypothetical protein